MGKLTHTAPIRVRRRLRGGQFHKALLKGFSRACLMPRLCAIFMSLTVITASPKLEWSAGIPCLALDQGVQGVAHQMNQMEPLLIQRWMTCSTLESVRSCQGPKFNSIPPIALSPLWWHAHEIRQHPPKISRIHLLFSRGGR